MAAILRTRAILNGVCNQLGCLSKTVGCQFCCLADGVLSSASGSGNGENTSSPVVRSAAEEETELVRHIKTRIMVKELMCNSLWLVFNNCAPHKVISMNCKMSFRLLDDLCECPIWFLTMSV